MSQTYMEAKELIIELLEFDPYSTIQVEDRDGNVFYLDHTFSEKDGHLRLLLHSDMVED